MATRNKALEIVYNEASMDNFRNCNGIRVIIIGEIGAIRKMEMSFYSTY